ncbi:hypothetical protein Landi51_10182 [Colletotrichum acutatum]
MEKTMVSPPAASPSTISPASSSHLGKRHDHSEDAQESSSGGGYNGGGPGGDGAPGSGRKSSSSGGSRPKRAQVSRACARCKNLRRACNEYRPCKRCVDAGLGDQCLGLPGPVSLAWVSDGSQAFGHVPREAVQRMADLLPARVMDYCVDRFFARLHPTIPILTPDRDGGALSPDGRVRAGAASGGGAGESVDSGLDSGEECAAWADVVRGGARGASEFREAVESHPGFLVPERGNDVVPAAADEYARGVGESGGGGAGGSVVLGSVGVGAVARDPSAGYVVYRAVEYGKGGDAAVERGVDVYRDGGERGAAVDFGPQGYAKGEFEGDAAVVADYTLAAAFAVRLPCRRVCSLAEHDVSLPSRGGQGPCALDAGFTRG